MNVFILTLGSRGDVQPFVALGCGLKAAGHNVTVATSSSFEPFITEHGLNYGYLNNELMDLMDTEAGRGAMEDAVGVLGSIKTMAKLAKEGNRINRLLLKESWEAAKLAQPDLIIFHPKAFAGAHIADKCGIPAIVAVLQPMLVSTGEMPPIGFPQWNLGGWYNKLGYKLINMGYNSYRGMVNTFREESLGIAKLAGSGDIINVNKAKPLPVMHAFSEHVIPRPQDWDENAMIAGYFFLDSDSSWQAPAELTNFLDAGDAPVYVGFGSMAGRNPEALTKIVIEALQEANVRGLIATGWGGLSVSDLPKSIFKIEQAPHDWLFDRVSAVVHHGGAGTTAAGLRAGRPTVICSFIADQPFWGERVYKLGVGPKYIPQKKITVESLASAIREATSNPSISQKARVLGEQIRQEDGIANAIAYIEKITGHR